MAYQGPLIYRGWKRETAKESKNKLIIIVLTSRSSNQNQHNIGSLNEICKLANMSKLEER